jgi:hypothetical protein
MLAAQQATEDARAAALRDAERFADCWTDAHPLCMEDLTDLERLAAAGLPAPDVQSMRSILRIARGMWNSADLFHWMEVAEPWPPFTIDDAMFAFVPYFETSGVSSQGTREERVGYLIGASDDGGESWRFIQIDEDIAAQPEAIDRVVPGYRDRPRPEVFRLEIQESPFAKSDSVETIERAFVPVEGAFAYSVRLRLRRDSRGPIDFSVRYENPADRNQLLQVHGSLESGQRHLQWQSPASSSFETGQVYSIVIEGRDTDTGELLFTHHEELLFRPTRELWRSVLSRPPGESAE